MKQKAWSNWLNWIAGSFIILIFSSFIAGKGGFDWKKITETECCLAHAKYKERPHKGAKSFTLSSHISIPLEPRRVGINHPFLHHWYSSHDSLSMGLHAFGRTGVERKDTRSLLSKFTDPHSQTSQCISNEGLGEGRAAEFCHCDVLPLKWNGQQFMKYDANSEGAWKIWVPRSWRNCGGWERASAAENFNSRLHDEKCNSYSSDTK